MKPSHRALLAVCVLIPSLALAGDMTAALSLGGSWGLKTLGIARGLFPAMLMLGLIVELVFKEPSSPASLRLPVWRATLVLVLLVGLQPPSVSGSRVSNSTVYGWVCFGLAGLSDSISAAVAPEDVWKRFGEVTKQWMEELQKGYAASEHSSGDAVGIGFAAIGGALFSTLIALGMGLGQAAMWVMGELGKVLAILLYALGPLALVFWIPRTSDSLGRWLRTFITILSWPVLSAVILNVIVAGGLKGLAQASPAFACISTSLLLGVAACAVPVLSSSLVGGSLGAIGSGLSAVTMAGSAALGATAAAAGAGSRAASAGAGLAGQAAGFVASAATSTTPGFGAPAGSGPAGGFPASGGVGASPAPSFEPGVERWATSPNSLGPPPPPRDAWEGALSSTPGAAANLQGPLSMPAQSHGSSGGGGGAPASNELTASPSPSPRPAPPAAAAPTGPASSPAARAGGRAAGVVAAAKEGPVGSDIGGELPPPRAVRGEAPAQRELRRHRSSLKDGAAK